MRFLIKKILFCTFVLFFFGISAIKAQTNGDIIIVTNAGEISSNQAYIYHNNGYYSHFNCDGTVDTSRSSSIQKNENLWQIKANSGTVLYDNSVDTAKPISNSWVVKNGLAPAPEILGNVSNPFLINSVTRKTPTDASIFSNVNPVFNVVFSKAATNVDSSDFIINSTAGGTISTVNQINATTYEVGINNLNNVDGAVGLQIKGIDGASGSNDILSPEINYENGVATISQTNDNDYLNQSKIGQTFKATTDNYFTAFTIFPEAGQHTFNGTATLNVYTGNEATLQTSETITLTNSTINSGQTFNLTNPIKLTQGNSYSFTLENFNGSGSHALTSSTSGNYIDGKVIFTDSNAGHNNFDLKFDIFEGTKIDGISLLDQAPITNENFTVVKNNLPVASQVSISGTLNVGETLTGTYTWTDADTNDTESGSTYQWYSADDNNGLNKLAISNATATTYVLSNDDTSKFISFEVTPSDGKLAGLAEESNTNGPVKKTQTITFNTLNDKTYGDNSFTLNATTNSGLPISYASSNTNIITITGNTATIVGTGTINITASQSGDTSFDEADDVIQSLTVNKASLQITADAKSKVYGTINPALTYQTSGLEGSDVLTGELARESGEDAGIYLINQGTIDSGNNYTTNFINADFTITKADQTITFGTLTHTDDRFTLTATASSGLDITYTSSDATIATITSDEIQIISAGTVIITASQAGNINFNAATDVQQSLTISALSTHEVSLNDTNVILYPNPTKDDIRITIGDEKATITVYDISGKEVFSMNNYQSKETVPTTKLKTGVYVLRVICNDKIFTKRLIKI